MKGLLVGRLAAYPYDCVKLQRLSGNKVAVFWVEENGLVMTLGVMRGWFLGLVGDIPIVK